MQASTPFTCPLCSLPLAKAADGLRTLYCCDGGHRLTAETLLDGLAAGSILNTPRPASADEERRRVEETLRTNEERMRGQKEAFQLAIDGAPLAGSLSLLARIADGETGGEARTAFYLANAAGGSLHPVYGAGNMPDDYLNEVDGFPIGTDSLACGLAVPTGLPVITPDVLEHPLWQPWTWLAEAYGFRGCWSFPIKTRDSKGIGTFAMYFRHPREASPRDRALADIVTQSAAIIMTSHAEAQERARAEEALRVSEERYRIALQSAGMAAWDWNVAEDAIRWNDQHFLLVGLPPEDRLLNAAFFMRFVHPDDRPLVSDELIHAVEESGVYRMEAFRIVRADTGQVCWMTGYGRAVAWRDGSATRMVGVMYDITSRMETTLALRDKRLKLEIAQRAARIGIWSYDPVTRIGTATLEWKELTGYPQPGETFSLEVFLTLVHPDDRSTITAAYDYAIWEHGSVELEFRLQHPEGRLLWLLKRGQFIPAQDGMNAAFMGSLIDITERKRLEQQKEEFIGIASHELRTPVTSIRAYAEILEEIFEESGNEESAVLMRKMSLQVDRLNSLIYSLLDATRITEGRLELQKTPFEIDSLIRDTAEMMRPTAGGHRIVLSLDAPVLVAADRERIRQVLVNLIGNALKFSPGADRIVVQSGVENGQLKVCVQDWGIGISEAGQQRVFDRFFRDAQAGTYSGLGLGLFISASIVR